MVEKTISQCCHPIAWDKGKSHLILISSIENAQLNTNNEATTKTPRVCLLSKKNTILSIASMRSKPKRSKKEYPNVSYGVKLLYNLPEINLLISNSASSAYKTGYLVTTSLHSFA